MKNWGSNSKSGILSGSYLGSYLHRTKILCKGYGFRYRRVGEESIYQTTGLGTGGDRVGKSQRRKAGCLEKMLVQSSVRRQTMDRSRTGGRVGSGRTDRPTDWGPGAESVKGRADGGRRKGAGATEMVEVRVISQGGGEG